MAGSKVRRTSRHTSFDFPHNGWYNTATMITTAGTAIHHHHHEPLPLDWEGQVWFT